MTDEQLGPCLQAQFRAQALKTPNRIALLSQHATISYAQLDRATDELACMLLKQNVTKNHCVGILMERRNEYALAYIGILKAGGAYLPLDPAYPTEMLQNVLVDSQPTVIVTTSAFVDRIPSNIPTLVLSSDWNSCLERLDENDKRALQEVDDEDLDALAYIVYSSGTTGKPKGIACPHRGAVFSYKWRHANIPYQEYTTQQQQQ